MDDNAPKENPAADFNKLDLTQLQGFSFGTQWTQDKSAPSDRRDRNEQGSERPRRDDGRDAPGGPDRRDRRSFRRPAGPGSGPGTGPSGAPAGGAVPERRPYAGERPPRQGGGDYRGGPRRDAPAGERAPRYDRGTPQDRGPYESPFYGVTFYPEDTSFNTLVQTIRKSCRTVELFEIARTVVAKTDRFVVVIVHKTPPGGETARADAGADGGAKPKPLFYLSVPDGMPFESDEAAVAHVLGNHLDKFFTMAEVEVDPPKGNFQVINKCGITGELLGPPNYHRYNQIVQQHHAAKLPRMAFDAFRSRIETIRDPEIVNQWLAKMKKATRYTWNFPAGGKPAVVPAAAGAKAPVAGPEAGETPAGGTETPAPVDAPAVDAAASAPAEAAPVVPPVPTFDALEEARVHLLTHARDKVVRAVEHARVHGKVAETMPPGEIRRAVEGALERQRRFPLDTANALRGRLRREHFTIFKKGSKGISYVCAVKRKFRVPGQTFADSIGALISFIESHPMIRASELQTKFLGIAAPATPRTPDTPAAPAAEASPETGGAVPLPADPAAKVEPTLTIEERARISRMQGDLMWLVREGYVTEFIDGRLFAPPPMVEARKKEVEAEEHDPENFPEIPPSSEAVETKPAVERVEAPAESVADAAPAPAPATPDVAASEPGPVPPAADETKPAS